ncbi:MAG: sugar phosphate isomerase/epimerase [Nitrosopumilus sp.]|nr:sugar phosphate isomerase/epimerase [Nitrosopumilus sp.]
MRNKIGIMQGRLSNPVNNEIQAFPTKEWRDEFAKAEKIGYELLEWVFDSLDNPIISDKGTLEIKKYIKNSKIDIHSVCADYFMKNLLFDLPKNEIEKNLKVLIKLIHHCSKLGIKIIELPFVDSSSLLKKNKVNEILKNLKPIIPLLEENNIILTLETDLPPDQFYDLLNKFNSPYIKANYDIGNSISNGFDPELEISILKDHIFNVHIKDRIFHGNTVTLGTGDVDFDVFFASLAKINYEGDLIIQGAREDLEGKKINPEKTCSKYLTFVKKYLSNL